MKINHEINIIKNKAKISNLTPYCILFIGLIFFIAAILKLFFLDNLIAPFNNLDWPHIIDMLFEVNLAGRYVGIELKAVCWLYQSILYFLVAFFCFNIFLYVKKDISCCKYITKNILKESKGSHLKY